MDGSPALLIESLAGLAMVAMLSLAALRAWRGWLDLRRETLAGGGSDSGGQTDIRTLRERVRRLETIASGLDG